MPTGIVRFKLEGRQCNVVERKQASKLDRSQLQRRFQHLWLQADDLFSAFPHLRDAHGPVPASQVRGGDERS